MKSNIDLPEILFLLGLIGVFVGMALIYIPLALIFGGISIMIAGLYMASNRQEDDS